MRDYLYKLGATFVIRAAQSKGKVDLLALWERDTLIELYPPWLVQAKRDGRLPKAERTALLELADKTGSLALLAKTGPNGRGVELVELREEND